MQLIEFGFAEHCLLSFTSAIKGLPFCRCNFISPGLKITYRTGLHFSHSHPQPFL